MAQDKSFDRLVCIFCDINMPVMDGYKTNKSIKDLFHSWDKQPPCIIACTAYVGGEEIETIKRAFDYYLPKPIMYTNFKVMLEQIFDEFTERKEEEEHKSA